MEQLRNNYIDLDFDRFLPSSSFIKNNFFKIWKLIIQKTRLDTIIDIDKREIKNLVIYEIIDGTRSTLAVKQMIDRNLEAILFTLNFIYILQTLGVKNCYIMVHTTYNRKRGINEFNKVLKKIAIGASLIKKFSIKYNICCSFIGIRENYEYLQLLNEIAESTKNGYLHTYFLLDYNEEWILNKDAQNLLQTMPDIDVHIRHTKFQPSGGWIPCKMSHSAFLYSQNGSTYSNWDPDEIIALIALSLFTKLIHKGEILNKSYSSKEELQNRYRLRELELFNKKIELQSNPKKLFMMGSPVGVYQFYY